MVSREYRERSFLEASASSRMVLRIVEIQLRKTISKLLEKNFFENLADKVVSQHAIRLLWPPFEPLVCLFVSIQLLPFTSLFLNRMFRDLKAAAFLPSVSESRGFRFFNCAASFFFVLHKLKKERDSVQQDFQGRRAMLTQ